MRTQLAMITSWYGNGFLIIGPLLGGSNGDQVDPSRIGSVMQSCDLVLNKLLMSFRGFETSRLSYDGIVIITGPRCEKVNDVTTDRAIRPHCEKTNRQHWNGYVVNLTKVVVLTIFGAARDEDFGKMSIFPFQWINSKKPMGCRPPDLSRTLFV